METMFAGFANNCMGQSASSGKTSDEISGTSDGDTSKLVAICVSDADDDK